MATLPLVDLATGLWVVDATTGLPIVTSDPSSCACCGGTTCNCSDGTNTIPLKHWIVTIAGVMSSTVGTSTCAGVNGTFTFAVVPGPFCGIPYVIPGATYTYKTCAYTTPGGATGSCTAVYEVTIDFSNGGSGICVNIQADQSLLISATDNTTGMPIPTGSTINCGTASCGSYAFHTSASCLCFFGSSFISCTMSESFNSGITTDGQNNAGGFGGTVTITPSTT